MNRKVVAPRTLYGGIPIERRRQTLIYPPGFHREMGHPIQLELSPVVEPEELRLSDCYTSCLLVCFPPSLATPGSNTTRLNWFSSFPCWLQTFGLSSMFIDTYYMNSRTNPHDGRKVRQKARDAVD